MNIPLLREDSRQILTEKTGSDGTCKRACLQSDVGLKNLLDVRIFKGEVAIILL
jgi:hypothetical protein